MVNCVLCVILYKNVIVYVTNPNFDVDDVKFGIFNAKLDVELPKILRCYC